MNAPLDLRKLVGQLRPCRRPVILLACPARRGRFTWCWRGEGGVPEVLPGLCLHCQNGLLVCAYSWLSVSVPFCGGGLMFFPWPIPLEGWPSTATSAQPPLRLTRWKRAGVGRRRGRGLFYLKSVSTRASAWCKRVGVSLSLSLFPWSHLPPPKAFCVSSPPFALLAGIHAVSHSEQTNNADGIHLISRLSASC